MLLHGTFPVGAFQANCTVLADRETREALVIDPGADPATISKFINNHGLIVKAIVLTHAHIDHVMAVRDVKEAHGGEICLHPADRWLYRGVAMQAAMFGMRPRTAPPVDRPLSDGDRLDLGPCRVTVIETPGHSPGSVCLEVVDPDADQPLLLSGDTLFHRGVGRTDLWGGDRRQLERSIREQLYALDPATTVIPGHGPGTTIGEEMRDNPFVRRP